MGALAGSDVAKAGNASSIAFVNTNPCSQVWNLFIDLLLRCQFTDIYHRVGFVTDEEAAWPMQIVPLSNGVAFGVKYLEPVIFPIRHIDQPFSIRANRVDDIKFSRIGSRGAP